jgi:hypothetical protein
MTEMTKEEFVNLLSKSTGIYFLWNAVSVPYFKYFQLMFKSDSSSNYSYPVLRNGKFTVYYCDDISIEKWVSMFKGDEFACFYSSGNHYTFHLPQDELEFEILACINNKNG